MESKYTFVYDPRIEALLDATLCSIAEEARAHPSFRYLKFLILGGGYGRGEGGILKKENGESALYNDLDFFVISNTTLSWRNNLLNKFYEQLAKKWRLRLGIDVDFSKARNVKYIKKRSHIMVWKEMILSPLFLIGDKDEFQKYFSTPSLALPPSEAAKLLVNRMSGLFLAKQRLHGSNPLSFEDYDFIARNTSKAVLACGDALLIACEKYTLSIQERLQCLKKLHSEKTEGLDELKALYEEAVSFKKTPIISQEKDLCSEKLQQATSLCLKTIHSLKQFLNTPVQQTALRKIKGYFLILQLKKYFYFLNIDFRLAKNIYFCFIILLMGLLKSPKRASDALEQAYRKNWNYIG